MRDRHAINVPYITGEPIAQAERRYAMTFQNGSRVLVTYHGQTVRASVFTASDNGLSLMLLLDGHLGMYEVLMPVVWLEDGYVDLLNAQPVNIQISN